MPEPKSTIVGGSQIHFSVGAVIKRAEKYLLINNRHYGWAGVAGHIDEGEEPLHAVKREVLEESGLKVDSCELLFEEMIAWNWCHRGVTGHHWYLYECTVTGNIKQNTAETESIGWYTVEEIKKFELEPVWKYWFERLEII